MVQLQFYVMTSMLPSILAANALCKDKILKQFVSTKRNHCTYAEQIGTLRRSRPQPSTYPAKKLVMGEGREGRIDASSTKARHRIGLFFSEQL